MNIKQHIDLKLKEAEDLYKKLTEQEEQVSKAKQQTLGRVAALQELVDLSLQSERKEIDTDTDVDTRKRDSRSS